MKHSLPILVFTDLDGTLLDHDCYSYAPARDALKALRDVAGGVVLASSKTAAEIAPLRDELGLQDWPAIVENGAGILAPGSSDTGKSSDYQKIRAALDQLPMDVRHGFRGFGDMSATEVAEMTSMATASAALAQDRRHSEPGTWTGSESDRQRFVDMLAQGGISARMGGRFLTLSFGQTKADRMDDLIERYAPKYSVALGDAPNDAEMLERADFGFVVANPHAPPLPPLKGEEEGRIQRTGFPGPFGWNTAILGLLVRLQLLPEIRPDV